LSIVITPRITGTLPRSSTSLASLLFLRSRKAARQITHGHQAHFLRLSCGRP
jgi:hypothetical protein